MSQNGPVPGPSPSGGSSDEPYAEPADPWREHSVAGPGWTSDPAGIPQQPVPSYGGTPGWPSPVRKRQAPILALIVVMGMLIAVGLGAGAWLLTHRHKPQATPPQTSSPAAIPPSAAGNEDARFVTEGECVANQGTDKRPRMREAICGPGTYQVLKVIKGKTTGERDAERKCARVDGYTNWYFYDTEFDDLDVVLCLQRR